MSSDILKYHRVQDKLPDILATDRITSTAVETNSLIFGTEEGFVHILSFAGHLTRSIKAHDRPINCVSVDSGGRTIASCSDNGSVVIHTISTGGNNGDVEIKESVVHFNQAVKAVCIDEDSASGRKDRSFVAGTVSGQLIYHHTVWFTQKSVVLFNGAGSPVNSIAWRGNIVAWADATQVRLLDISTQTAICYLSCPSGIGLDAPLPCSLFWESESDLFVGWGDQFRHIELTATSSSIGSGGGVSGNNTTVSVSAGGGSSATSVENEIITARSVADWNTDCIICGIASFDADHVIVLGYVPPDEETVSLYENKGVSTSVPELQSTSVPGKDDDGIVNRPLPVSNIINRPEIQIISRFTGEVKAVDTLPLRGETMQGPWSYRLLSSYHCTNAARDAHKWKLSDVLETRGGFRGLSPTNFVVSPQDFVVARVRDINDFISTALARGDLLAAVNLALSDKLSLRYYRFHDLITLYLEDLLLRQKKGDHAAAECGRLLGDDAILWERWIYAFAKLRCLDEIAAWIPTAKPRLPNTVYEVVIESFLQSNSCTVLDVIEKWGRLKPPLFSHQALIQRLETIRGKDWFLLETLAQLYLISQQYEKAVNCYLEIKNLPPPPSPNSSSSANDQSSHQNKNHHSQAAGDSGGDDRNSNSTKREEVLLGNNHNNNRYAGRKKNTGYQHVFDLIEKQSMFDLVREKVAQLALLSQDHAANLLVKHIDKIPVKSVVAQLRNDRRLLHWYLHTLFTRLPDHYNSQEYSDYHIMQLSLYAEFTPARTTDKQQQQQQQVREEKRSKSASMNVNNYTPITEQEALLAACTQQRSHESDFLLFLKKSNYIPLEMALKECEKRKPPLYDEMVYILGRLGNAREALTLLLREIGDVSRAIEFVESHDQQLWVDLVDYSLQNTGFLAKLLDHVGVCSLNPINLISQIPANVNIPNIRQRLLRILRQYNFQVELSDKCNISLEEDTLELLRGLNQGRRRAMKVDCSVRCAECFRPAFLPPPPPSANTLSTSASDSKTAADAATTINSSSSSSSVISVGSRIWGHAAGIGGTNSNSNSQQSTIVSFANKLAYHRQCYESMLAAANNAANNTVSSGGTVIK